MTALLETREIQIAIKAFWPMLKQGLINSIPLTLVSFAIGMVIAILSALLIINRVPILSQVMRFYVWVFRGTPLLVQLFIVYWGICNPMKISNLIACVIALSLNVGAYASETIRAAILSIDKGQWEAAKALGLSAPRTFLRIILPQTVKRVIPAIGNEVITLVKDTSLAFTIAVTEMFTLAKQLASANTTMAPLIAAGVFYYIFNYIVAWAMERIEKRLAYYD